MWYWSCFTHKLLILEWIDKDLKTNNIYFTAKQSNLAEISRLYNNDGADINPQCFNYLFSNPHYFTWIKETFDWYNYFQCNLWTEWTTALNNNAYHMVILCLFYLPTLSLFNFIKQNFILFINTYLPFVLNLRTTNFFILLWISLYFDYSAHSDVNGNTYMFCSVLNARKLIHSCHHSLLIQSISSFDIDF